MTDLNLPLLRKTVDWAAAEAARVDGMSEYNQQNYFTTEAPCGTAYCIAGKIAIDLYPTAKVSHLNFIEMEVEHEGGDITRLSPNAVAEEALGISGVNHTLFSAANSIEDVRREADRLARTYAGEPL